MAKVGRRDVLRAAGVGLAAAAVGTPARGAGGEAGGGMHPMTAANLRSAHGGESMAHMRYKVWGAKAQEEGFPNVARLFRAIAYAEEVHASNHFRHLGNEGGAFLVASMAGFGLGNTSANLAGAIEGELFEVNEMYPAYLRVAKDQGEKGAVETFRYALSAERVHAKMYADAKKSVDAGKDPRLGPIHVCSVCGYTLEGQPPGTCPICGASFKAFRKFQ